MALAGCGAAPSYDYGVPLAGMLFSPTSAGEGVHPDTSVVRDPNNPFRTHAPGAKTKWALLEGGVSVAAFYAFATALAHEPVGENQFWAAKSLEEIALSGAVADASRRDDVRRLAVAAYQSVLDHFPDARGYDATGTVSYRLATPAYKAIVALGGVVRGDWLLVTTATGEEAVRGSSTPTTEGAR